MTLECVPGEWDPIANDPTLALAAECSAMLEKLENELLTASGDRVFEIEDVGAELEPDEDYASYELIPDDNPFVDEAKTPIWFAGDSIAAAVRAACASQQHVEPASGRSERARGVRIATHCASVAQFVHRFHPYCAEQSIFVEHATGDVGSRLVFSFDLEDRTTVFCGLGIVTDQFTDEANRFGRRGIAIRVTRLRPDSQRVFEDLLAARAKSQHAPAKPVDADHVQCVTEPSRATAIRAAVKAALVSSLRPPKLSSVLRVVPASSRQMPAADPKRLPASTPARDFGELAREVARWRALALLAAAAGDNKQAHRLLHEAHRLDPHSLPIALALGESCLARKLWREAVRYLVPLADHPDARRYAARVADALVRVGHAEARALLPANALKHYETAVRLDPQSPAAWHALAVIAMERGDVEHAIECFEREAMGTKCEHDRNRLFDALGDLAHDVLHDPARAEAYWTKIVDADAPVLRKLLAVQRQCDAVEAAETCLRLAAVDPSQHKALTQEAAERFAASGDFARARACAKRLIEMHPFDAGVVSCACTVVLAVGDVDTAVGWLRRALEAWHAEPREAEMWRRLGDMERSRERTIEAIAAYERAIAIGTDSPHAVAARRALLELNPSSTTIESLEALVEVDPSPDEVLALARRFVAADRVEDARATYDLALALRVGLSSEDEELLARTAPRMMGYDEAYRGHLDDEARTLIDDATDSVVGSLLDLLGEGLGLLAPDPRSALRAAGFPDAAPLSMMSNAAIAAMYPQVSKALGGPPTLLFWSRDLGDQVRVVLAAPPVLVIGSDIKAIRGVDVDPMIDPTLRFICGRVVELTRPRRIFAVGRRPDEFALLLDALWYAFGRQTSTTADVHVVNEAKRVRSRLPIAIQRRIRDLIAGVPRESLDASAYIASCNRAADRSGLLACGHVAAAIDLCSEPDLIRLTASRSYRRARRALHTQRSACPTRASAVTAHAEF